MRTASVARLSGGFHDYFAALTGVQGGLKPIHIKLVDDAAPRKVRRGPGALGRQAQTGSRRVTRGSPGTHPEPAPPYQQPVREP